MINTPFPGSSCTFAPTLTVVMILCAYPVSWVFAGKNENNSCLVASPVVLGAWILPFHVPPLAMIEPIVHEIVNVLLGKFSSTRVKVPVPSTTTPVEVYHEIYTDHEADSPVKILDTKTLVSTVALHHELRRPVFPNTS